MDAQTSLRGAIKARDEIIAAYQEYKANIEMMEARVPALEQHPKYIEGNKKVEQAILGALDTADKAISQLSAQVKAQENDSES